MWLTKKSNNKKRTTAIASLVIKADFFHFETRPVWDWLTWKACEPFKRGMGCLCLHSIQHKQVRKHWREAAPIFCKKKKENKKQVVPRTTYSKFTAKKKEHWNSYARKVRINKKIAHFTMVVTGEKTKKRDKGGRGGEFDRNQNQ